MRLTRGAFNAAAANHEAPDEIPSNAIFFCVDGKVHGNEAKLVKGLVDVNNKSIEKNKGIVHVHE